MNTLSPKQKSIVGVAATQTLIEVARRYDPKNPVLTVVEVKQLATGSLKMIEKLGNETAGINLEHVLHAAEITGEIVRNDSRYHVRPSVLQYKYQDGLRYA